MQTGHVANERLLMLYGFAIPNNPYASVRIYAAMEVESANGDSLHGTRLTVKRDALHRMGIQQTPPFRLKLMARVYQHR